ncbi:MAG: DUF484 family protein [Gammaproteobacteria bacterium]|nr:DUF484 family protein [Gammaproteobacteria bacterium]
MSIETLEEGDIVLQADDVAAYLRKHPRFLSDEYSDILTDIEIPHRGADGATSLIERQVRVMREQQRALRNQIRDLIEIARTNERLVARLHRLTQALILAQDLESVLDIVSAQLRQDFHADAVRAKFWTPSVAERIPAAYADLNALSVLFATAIKRGQVVCGQFSKEQMETLFGANATGLQSAALLPLAGPRAALGLVAVASKDPQRFAAGMSTVFLSQLAETLTNVLRRYIPEMA